MYIFIHPCRVIISETQKKPEPQSRFLCKYVTVSLTDYLFLSSVPLTGSTPLSLNLIDLTPFGVFVCRAKCR